MPRGPARPRLELQLRKLDTRRGFRFGGLGLAEKQASQHNRTSKPQPTKLAAPAHGPPTPRHSHTSQVLSCSFKNDAPICPGAESGPNQNSSSAEPIPSTLQGCITAKLGFHIGYRPGNLTSPKPPQASLPLTRLRLPHHRPRPFCRFGLTDLSGRTQWYRHRGRRQRHCQDL